MKRQPSLSHLVPWLLTLVLFLGSAWFTPSLEAQVPSAQAPSCGIVQLSSPNEAPVLLAHWTDHLRDRSRIMQLAFVGILLGIFMLRWGGR